MVTLFCINSIFDAEATGSVEKGKEIVKTLRNRGSESIDTRVFQRNLNQGVVEWTKALESKLKKDSKNKKIETPEIKATEEQKRIAEDIVNQSREIIDEALDVSISKKEDLGIEGADFLIFASFGMGEKNLENLIKMATKYNGIVVMRGFKDGDIKSTAGFLTKFIEKTGLQSVTSHVGITIDPELFKEYGIRRVPSFVLTKACVGVGDCKKKYDILRGNVTPRFALEKFSIDGDLADDARRRLDR